MSNNPDTEINEILNLVYQLHEKINRYFSIIQMYYVCSYPKETERKKFFDKLQSVVDLLCSFNTSTVLPNSDSSLVFSRENMKLNEYSYGFIDLAKIYKMNWWLYRHVMFGLTREKHKDVKEISHFLIDSINLLKKHLVEQLDSLNEKWKQCLTISPELDLEYPEIVDVHLLKNNKVLFTDLLSFCQNSVVWEKHTMNFSGKTINVPRSIAWYGPIDYTYSGLTHSACSMPEVIQKMHDSIVKMIHTRFPDIRENSLKFNGVLLNKYHDGRDSISWHSDNESSMGNNPIIVSISLGAERTFMFREKANHKNKISFELVNNSCLVMYGKCQKLFEHSIPKQPGVTDLRINLTFRFSI